MSAQQSWIVAFLRAFVFIALLSALVLADSDGDDDGDDDQGSSMPSGPPQHESHHHSSNKKMVKTAHAALASLAFVIFFPAGAISIRAIPSKVALWMHIAWQMLAYILFIAAFGMGVYIAQGESYKYHQKIGIVVFSFISLQPMLGVLHHVLFKKHQKRTIWSHVHLWLGRVLVTLGMINGGLGLRLADDASNGAYIAYGVIAAIVWVVWMAAAVWGEIQRLRKPSGMAAPQAQTPDGEYYAKEGDAGR